MKPHLLLSLFLFLSLSFNAQPERSIGEEFTLDVENELDPKLVLVDDYNIYLMSCLNQHGIIKTQKILLRKFDQANTLIETFTHDYSSTDVSVLHNYLGSFENFNNQLIILTESYSGKTKKKDIQQHVFDKTTEKFATTIIASYPIESNMKSGATYFMVSHNKQFYGIMFEAHSGRKEPQKNHLVICDANTLNKSWDKELSFENDYYERAVTLTNSGKVVLLRGAKGLKISNYLVLVSPDNQVDINLEEKIQLQRPFSYSIGKDEYLIAFNHDAEGLRAGNYEKILVMNLSTGKVLQNNKISVFNSVKDLEDVFVRDLFVTQDEIQLFVEAKVKSGTVPKKVNEFSSTTTQEPVYKLGPAYALALSTDGELKKNKRIDDGSYSKDDLYHSFGVVNVNGVFYINTGIARGIYKLEINKEEKSDSGMSLVPVYHADTYNAKFINQFVLYRDNGQRLTLVRFIENNKFRFFTYKGFH